KGTLLDADGESLTGIDIPFFTMEVLVFFFFEAIAETVVMGVALVIRAEEPSLAFNSFLF
ncbi:hypothetical protein A2U01_0101043, partial [Trifolium medium]|nr:hypothetical protein [Trifolium medium]